MKSGTFEYFGDGVCLRLPEGWGKEGDGVRRRPKPAGILPRSNRGLGGHGIRGFLRRLLNGWASLARFGAPVPAGGTSPEAKRAALSRYFYC
jgi:hypothetical protein